MTGRQMFDPEFAPPGSSLYYSLSVLDPGKREAALAVHALVRVLRRIPFECQDRTVALQTLSWWRDEIGRMLEHRPRHPLTVVLAAHQADRPLPPDWYSTLVDGAAMDLDYGRYPGFPQLMAYCHRVGSTPAMMVSHWLGQQDRATTGFAHDAGLAMLLFRLLTEVRKDAQRGRCYLPEDELAQFEVTIGELSGANHNDRLTALFSHQGERIRMLWTQALGLLPKADRRTQLAQVALGELLMARLREIELDGFRLLQRGVHLPPLRKLMIVWRTRWRIRRS